MHLHDYRGRGTVNHWFLKLLPRVAVFLDRASHVTTTRFRCDQVPRMSEMSSSVMSTAGA